MIYTPTKANPTVWLLNTGLFLLGIYLLYSSFSQMDLASLGASLSQANYAWASVIVLVSVVGFVARAYRWQLLYPPGDQPKLGDLFAALMSGYMISLAIPRAGEVTRCGMLQKKSGHHLAYSLGTVVTERVVDVGCLVLMVLLAFWLEPHELFRVAWAGVLTKLSAVDTRWVVLLAGGLALLPILSYVFRRRILAWKSIQFLVAMGQRFAAGAVRVFQLRFVDLLQFILMTVVIWVAYFLSSYMWLLAFEEMSDLSATTGMVLMVSGGVAKMLPIQGGGMGAYHYLVTEVLKTYGIAANAALALAIVNHGLQTVLNGVLGSVGFFWLAGGRGKAIYRSGERP